MSTIMFPDGSVIGKPSADCGRQRFLDKVNLPRPGALRRFPDGAALHLGAAVRNAYDDAGTNQRAVLVRLADEIAQHRLGHFEIRDDSILYRTDRHDVSRGASYHALGFDSDGEDFFRSARVPVDGYGRRFGADDPLALDVHQRGGRSEVDREIVREQP
jgi:hypothetical protein